MPLMFEPPDNVLKALGRMTLWFAELEFYINECLLGLHQPQTAEAAKAITKAEFSRRAKDLKDTLQSRSDGATLWRDPTRKPSIKFSPSLTDLSDQRNLLVHGIAYAVLENQNGQLVGRTYKFNPRSNQAKSIDDSSRIDEITVQIEKAVEQAKLIAVNLQLENQQKQGHS